MNNFLQKLTRLKTPVKIGITLGLVAAILGIYGGLFYLDVQDQIKGAHNRQQQLKTEKDNYEKRKREYQAFRTELTQLQQEQRKVHYLLGARLRNVKEIYEDVLSRGGR